MSYKTTMLTPSSSHKKTYRSSFDEVSDILDRAQQTMLGFTPDWSDRLLSSITSSDTSYPPYDLIKYNDHHYRIVLATAGFSKDELSVVEEKQKLIIKGKKHERKVSSEQQPSEETNSSEQWIHRGIATRKFSKVFMLADNVKVEDAKYEDGLLTVDVVQLVPPENEPKQIPIM